MKKQISPLKKGSPPKEGPEVWPEEVEAMFVEGKPLPSDLLGTLLTDK